MSLERKYDGGKLEPLVLLAWDYVDLCIEYCQIHVDLTRKENWLQIFSKSGKDSTADRRGIHQCVPRFDTRYLYVMP